MAGYNVYRDGTKIATTYSTSYADLGLESGTPHTYTVAALDGAANTSDPSTGASASAAPAPPSSVSYAYDLADRLTGITTASGSTTTFTIDALGRHASQTIGTDPTSSYSYLGTSDTVVAIASGSATTVSAIDALGDRVATSAPGSFGYLLPDLHGNAAGAFNAAGTAISDAFAYDAWGNVVASVTSALPTPWRYQGRMLESAPGTPALYDFSARSYNPALGAFISLDGVHGSAQNPALLNGYLYANANPATLVDPDGHRACSYAGSGLYCTDASYSGSQLVSTTSTTWGMTSSTTTRAGNATTTTNTTRTAEGTPAIARSGGPGGETPSECPVQTCGAVDQTATSATSRAGAYKTCLDNFANTRSGTSPDAGQQQMLCNAQVARHFDPPPTEDPMQALTALAVLGGVTVGVAVLAVGIPELSVSAWGYITASGATACVESGRCEKLADDLAPKAESGVPATGIDVEASVQWVANNANKMHHIFDDPGHDLDAVVNQIGSRPAVIDAAVRGLGSLPNGQFDKVVVQIAGQSVKVSGYVENGVIKIGTMYVPPK